MKGRKTRRLDRILQMLLVMSLILGLAFTSMAAPEETASSAEQETLQQNSSYELTMLEDEDVPLAVPKLWEQDPGPAHMITWGLFWVTAILMGLDIRRHHQRMKELRNLLHTGKKKLH